MPKKFDCITCSAPLDFEGKTMQKCGFCGTTVIVPAELFYSPGVGSPFADQSGLRGKAQKVAQIQELIRSGKKIEAIKVFRETFGTGLAEAKNAVEAMERGESFDVSQAQGFAAAGSSSIDPKFVRRVGIAGGGIIMAAMVAMFALIAGITAFVWFAVSSVEESDITSLQPMPVGASSDENGVVELLRVGGEGTGAGKFKDNRAVAVDGSGRIYSGDYSGGRIQVFDAEGKFLNQWSLKDGNNLYDLSALRDGTVYTVTNRGIHSYNGESGELLRRVRSTRFRGSAVGLDGKVYGVGRDGITVFDKDLTILNEFKNAASDASTSFGFEKVAVDGTGAMFLIDGRSPDVIKFSPQGKFLNRYPTEVRSPNSIAIDPTGRIYLADTSSIHAFSAEGREIATFKAQQAFGIAFNAEGDMFVASRPFVVKQRLPLE